MLRPSNVKTLAHVLKRFMKNKKNLTKELEPIYSPRFLQDNLHLPVTYDTKLGVTSVA